MEYVLVESYDGTIVRVPRVKKEEYLRTQNLIKKLLKEGKTISEIKELLMNNNEKN